MEAGTISESYSVAGVHGGLPEAREQRAPGHGNVPEDSSGTSAFQPLSGGNETISSENEAGNWNDGDLVRLQKFTDFGKYMHRILDVSVSKSGPCGRL